MPTPTEAPPKPAPVTHAEAPVHPVKPRIPAKARPSKDDGPVGNQEAATPANARNKLKELAEGHAPEQPAPSDGSEKNRFDPAELQAPAELKLALTELQGEIDKLNKAIAEAQDISREDVTLIIKRLVKSYNVLHDTTDIDIDTRRKISDHLQNEYEGLNTNEHLKNLPATKDKPEEQPPDVAPGKGFTRENVIAHLKKLGVENPSDEDIDKALQVLNDAFAAAAPESRNKKILKYGGIAIFVSLLLCQLVAGMDDSGRKH